MSEIIKPKNKILMKPKEGITWVKWPWKRTTATRIKNISKTRACKWHYGSKKKALEIKSINNHKASDNEKRSWEDPNVKRDPEKILLNNVKRSWEDHSKWPLWLSPKLDMPLTKKSWVIATIPFVLMVQSVYGAEQSRSARVSLPSHSVNKTAN